MSERSLIIFSAVVVCCLFAALGVFAQGEIVITPGKYRLTRTTKTSMDAQAVTRTTEECVTDTSLDPKSLLPDKENCEIKNLESADNKTSFDFLCGKTAENSAMKGHADYSAGGGGIEYLFKLEGSFEGQELIVESGGSGERIGDCAPQSNPGK